MEQLIHQGWSLEWSAYHTRPILTSPSGEFIACNLPGQGLHIADCEGFRLLPYTPAMDEMRPEQNLTYSISIREEIVKSNNQSQRGCASSSTWQPEVHELFSIASAGTGQSPGRARSRRPAHPGWPSTSGPFQPPI